jgi:hypothetical protein
MDSSSNDMVHNKAKFTTWKYIDKKWLEFMVDVLTPLIGVGTLWG